MTVMFRFRGLSSNPQLFLKHSITALIIAVQQITPIITHYITSLQQCILYSVHPVSVPSFLFHIQSHNFVDINLLPSSSMLLIFIQNYAQFCVHGAFPAIVPSETSICLSSFHITSVFYICTQLNLFKSRRPHIVTSIVLSQVKIWIIQLPSLPLLTTHTSAAAVSLRKDQA